MHGNTREESAKKETQEEELKKKIGKSVYISFSSRGRVASPL